MAGRPLNIVYGADASKALAAQKAIDAGHGRMQAGISKTGGFFRTTFGSAIPLSYAAAGAAAVLAGKFIVNAASAEGEALNKAKVIFEGSSDTVLKFAENSASSFGISKAAALDAAGGFGAMYNSAGIAGQAAADMSVQMVQLAGDMASFNNTDPSEMLERLRSGLSGEAEPLRRFGVFISEARVQSEAYRSGIAEVGEELTDAQKIQARYNIILEDTQKQQGDFARTVGESLPNQLRVFRAEVTDAAADLGRAFLPVLTQGLKGLGLLLDVTGPLTDNLDAVLTVLLGYAALKFLPTLLLQTAAGLEAIGLAAAGNKVLAVADGVTALGGSFATAAPAAAGFAVAFTGATAALTAWDPLGIVEDNEKLAASMSVNDVVLGRVARSSNLAGGSMTRFGATSSQAGLSLGDMQAKAALAASQQEDLAGETDAVTNALRGELDAMLALTDPTFALIDAVNQNRTAERELAAARQKVNQLARAGKTDTEAYRTAVQDLRSKSLEAAKSQASLFGSVRQFQQALTDGKASRRDAIAGLRDMGREAGLTDKEIGRLVKAVKTGLDDAGRYVRSHAPQVGRDLSSGIANGINVNDVAAKAVAAVKQALSAARAAAGADSPAKEWAKLGVDMMRGLQQGIERGGRSVERTLWRLSEKALDNLQKRLEDKLAKIEDQLGRVRGRASELSGAVSGGFGSFLDIGSAVTAFGEGTSPLSFFQGQLASAQQWASVLQALQTQGASSALLQAIAAQGPEALGFAQSILQSGPEGIEQLNQVYGSILDLQKETAKNLSEDYFGERIDELRDELREIKHTLKSIERIEAKRDNREEAESGATATSPRETARMYEGLLKMKSRNGRSLRLT